MQIALPTCSIQVAAVLCGVVVVANCGSVNTFSLLCTGVVASGLELQSVVGMHDLGLMQRHHIGAIVCVSLVASDQASSC